jgi:hypothetical protein
MDDDDLLALIRLCVSHQEEFVHGLKRDFWLTMAALLKNEIGKELRDPQSTMKGLVAGRRADLRRALQESGTVQEDTDLTQALDAWIEVLDEIEKQKVAKKRSEDQLAREALTATQFRNNLLVPRGEKRGISDIITDSEDESVANSRSNSRSTSRSMTEKREKEEKKSETKQLVAAVERMGDAVKQMGSELASAITNTGHSAASERLTRLENAFKERENREQNRDDMLARILEQVSHMRQD